MDVPDAAVLEQRRRDEQPVVVRLLHERDHHGQAVGRPRESDEPRIVDAHGDLGVEILEQVARETQLREHHQVRGPVPGGRDQLVVPGEVVIEGAQSGRDLGERDADRGHQGRV